MFQSVFDVHYTLKLVNHNPPLQINFVGMDFHGFSDLYVSSPWEYSSIINYVLYIILYYTILYYIVLYYMLFCYIILYCIILYYILLYSFHTKNVFIPHVPWCQE